MPLLMLMQLWVLLLMHLQYTEVYATVNGAVNAAVTGAVNAAVDATVTHRSSCSFNKAIAQLLIV